MVSLCSWNLEYLSDMSEAPLAFPAVLGLTHSCSVLWHCLLQVAATPLVIQAALCVTWCLFLGQDLKALHGSPGPILDLRQLSSRHTASWRYLGHIRPHPHPGTQKQPEALPSACALCGLLAVAECCWSVVPLRALGSLCNDLVTRGQRWMPCSIQV